MGEIGLPVWRPIIQLNQIVMLFREQDLEGPVWTVGELTAYIRELFDIDYRLRSLQIEGEISNFTQARSGHLYFTLKDENAQLKCVMWRSAADRLPFVPENGDAVVARGRVSVYEAGGAYQLYAESLEPAGRGELTLAFERMRSALASEGLFDEEHKKPIPSFPNKIGVVTSADAAALRDILNVLSRRWPLLSVLIAPTLVQGQDAPRQITRAIRWLDGRHDIDTIIVTRGGGSIEDLWAFNEESVARAIFQAEHPVIVGVGHETDFTIADFVADLRAPTPSAAAELAVPDRMEVTLAVQGLIAAAAGQLRGDVEARRNSVASLARALGHLSPQRRLENGQQQVDWLTGRLDQAMTLQLAHRNSGLMVSRTALNAVSPLATLGRGYAIIRNEDAEVVQSVRSVSSGDLITIKVADGDFEATVE
jgi:exodeoxyribonuclease VII large subunit